ncbi:MAG: hypothetical protein BWY11_00757 [Firmicutes bacterium ADurb.Bin182]|nr:MAG: hypothetical protein BWY11_00757 [Firmicutes bacterium ADurb.Bin182]
MNKHDYLSELEKELKAHHVCDQKDILEEYEEHFAMRLADGYTEEETCAKLAGPREIAEQYATIGEKASKGKAKNVFVLTGLIFLDLFVVPLFIVLFSWVFAVAALSAACSVLGVLLAGNLNIAGLIPYMPYPASLLLGAAVLSLAVLSALGMVYCYSLFAQLFKAYKHWHKGAAGGGVPYLPAPHHPQYSAKTRRRMRNLTLLALILFIVFSAAALILLIVLSGTLEPWHLWNWFN